MRRYIENSDLHRACCVAFIILVALFWTASTVVADITNTARADGTPDRGTLRSTSTTTSVPVEQLEGRLTVSQDLGGITIEKGADPTVTDEGDGVWFTVRMENTGNAPVTKVWPKISIPTFDGMPGTGEPPTIRFSEKYSTTPNPETLQPGQTAQFDIIYFLTRVDVLRGARKPEGLQHRAEGSGDSNPPSDVSIVAYQFPPDPYLVTTARVELDERYGRVGDGAAAVGDILTYTYFVENVGNVAIRNVTVSDVHEEADPHREIILSTVAMQNERLVRDGPLAQEAPSSDSVKNGSWDILEPGGVVMFSMVRTVSEVEYLGR